MKTKPSPRLPNVGEYVRGAGTLVAVQEIPPPPQPPPTVDYVFEEITAHCEIRHNGDKLYEFEKVWDFYGKGTSVESAIKTAKEVAEKRNIGPTSDIEVVAIQTTTQIRKRPTSKDNFYDRAFVEFESLGLGSMWDLPAPVETVVWSSKHPTKQTP